MANYNDLKTGIDAVIKTNGRQEISGAALNTQLKNMITELGAGYQYMGMATPATNPGTPDANVFYLASEAGTYTNFGGIVINEGEVCALVWNGTWTKDVTGAATADQLNQLGQKVNQLGQKVNPLVDTQVSLGMLKYGRIIANTWGNRSMVGHYMIRVSPGQKYRLSATAAGGTKYAILSQYPTYDYGEHGAPSDGPVFSSDPNFAMLLSLDASESVDFTTPSDAVCLYLYYENIAGLSIYTIYDRVATLEALEPRVTENTVGLEMIRKETRNLYKSGDLLDFTQRKIVNMNLPAGTYTVSALVTSTDTDANVCAIFFGGVEHVELSRGARSSKKVTLAEERTRIDFYASNSYNTSVGDIASFKDIQIELGDTATPYIPPYTADDEIAKESIDTINAEIGNEITPNTIYGKIKANADEIKGIKALTYIGSGTYDLNANDCLTGKWILFGSGVSVDNSPISSKVIALFGIKAPTNQAYQLVFDKEGRMWQRQRNSGNEWTSWKCTGDLSISYYIGDALPQFYNFSTFEERPDGVQSLAAYNGTLFEFVSGTCKVGDTTFPITNGHGNNCNFGKEKHGDFPYLYSPAWNVGEPYIYINEITTTGATLKDTITLEGIDYHLNAVVDDENNEIYAFYTNGSITAISEIFFAVYNMDGTRKTTPKNLGIIPYIQDMTIFGDYIYLSHGGGTQEAPNEILIFNREGVQVGKFGNFKDKLLTEEIEGITIDQVTRELYISTLYRLYK